MPEIGVDKESMIDAWAKIVVEKWHDKVQLLNIHDTDQLYNSLTDTMIDAGNNGDKIEFLVLLYGIFVDMGVGREMSKGNSGDLGFTPDRQPKPWYSSVFFKQVYILGKLLKERYGRETADLVFALLEVNDKRYSHGSDKAIESKKTMNYRPQTRIRSKRNYDKNRSQSGRWSSNRKWKPD